MNGKQRTPSLLLVQSVSHNTNEVHSSDGFESIDSSSDDLPPTFESQYTEDPLLRAFGRQSLELSSTQESQYSQLTQAFPDSQPPVEKKVPKSPARQMKIFQFARSMENEEVDEDPFYNTVNSIYIYFNKKRKIPVILQAIHESGGSVRNAIDLLRNKNYMSDGKLNFTPNTITADSYVIEQYFR